MAEPGYVKDRVVPVSPAAAKLHAGGLAKTRYPVNTANPLQVGAVQLSAIPLPVGTVTGPLIVGVVH